MNEDLTEAERSAAIHAIGDYLTPYINPMISGPEPTAETKERLIKMARVYMKLHEDWADTPVVLAMGGWQEEVFIDE